MRSMQDYDVALKLLLRSLAKLTMRELTGTVKCFGFAANSHGRFCFMWANRRFGWKASFGETTSGSAIAPSIFANWTATACSKAMRERETPLGQLFILSGLRHLEETVERELRKMPVFIDIL